jgi:hypothetical protein
MHKIFIGFRLDGKYAVHGEILFKDDQVIKSNDPELFNRIRIHDILPENEFQNFVKFIRDLNGNDPFSDDSNDPRADRGGDSSF